MPLNVTIDHPTRRIHVTATDPVTVADVAAAQEQQVTAGAWGFGTLIDVTAMHVVPDPASIRAFVDRSVSTEHRAGRRGPVAAVVDPSNVALYGMLRMMSIHAELEGQTIEVFRSRDQAVAWLSRPES